jgi:NADH-quinone oxidoreductase subunit L
MHHEQDMRFYGNLRKEIPFTFWAMLAGTLAITGVGVLGVFGFAGFYSKDAIIESAFASGSELGIFASLVGMFAALLTSFYSWRLMFLTFWGKPRWAGSEHIQHAVHHQHEDPSEEAAHGEHVSNPVGTAGYHPHESPLTMLVPLGLLSIGAVLAGFAFHHAFLEDAAFWGISIAYDEHLMHAMHEVPLLVKLSASIVMLLGLSVAYLAYIRNPGWPAAFVGQFGALHRFVFNKWYFDELYHAIFVKPAFWLGRLFWQRGDVGLIDRFGPNGAAWLVALSSRAAVRFQSGYLYSYALVMLVGLTAAISWAISR